MAQSNQPMHQNQQPQQVSPVAQPQKSDRVRVRVKSGRVLIGHGGGESDADTFAETGSVLEMTRAAYEAHLKSRTFDTYAIGNGEMGTNPHSVCDATLELVTDERAA